MRLETLGALSTLMAALVSVEQLGSGSASAAAMGLLISYALQVSAHVLRFKAVSQGQGTALGRSGRQRRAKANLAWWAGPRPSACRRAAWRRREPPGVRLGSGASATSAAPGVSPLPSTAAAASPPLFSALRPPFSLRPSLPLPLRPLFPLPPPPLVHPDAPSALPHCMSHV